MIRHVVMDMDGVLYRGDQPVPGAIETVQALYKQGVQVAFLTNNASRHRDEFVVKVQSLGLPCSIDQIWGVAYTTACYLRQYTPAARIFVVGASGLVREIQEAGLQVVATHVDATHVVAGLDPGINYEKLKQAHYAICNGATFIATNLDATYPDSATSTAPGGGAIVAALRTSTAVEPIVIGKPQTTGLSLIAASWGVAPERIAAIGDRLDTDTASARAFGCLAILVLTGITRREEAEQAVETCRPDIILPDLTALPSVLFNQR